MDNGLWPIGNVSGYNREKWSTADGEYVHVCGYMCTGVHGWAVREGLWDKMAFKRPNLKAFTQQMK